LTRASSFLASYEAHCLVNVINSSVDIVHCLVNVVHWLVDDHEHSASLLTGDVRVLRRGLEGRHETKVALSRAWDFRVTFLTAEGV
jgi:hypothetical protein